MVSGERPLTSSLGHLRISFSSPGTNHEKALETSKSTRGQPHGRNSAVRVGDDRLRRMDRVPPYTDRIGLWIISAALA